MKYRQKAEKVEAIQVRFGSRSWPSWLKGSIGLIDGSDASAINDGDFLVHEADGVRAYSAEHFAAKYEQVRQPREKNGNE